MYVGPDGVCVYISRIAHRQTVTVFSHRKRSNSAPRRGWRRLASKTRSSGKSRCRRSCQGERDRRRRLNVRLSPSVRVWRWDPSLNDGTATESWRCASKRGDIQLKAWEYEESALFHLPESKLNKSTREWLSINTVLRSLANNNSSIATAVTRNVTGIALDLRISSLSPLLAARKMWWKSNFPNFAVYSARNGVNIWLPMQKD